MSFFCLIPKLNNQEHSVVFPTITIKLVEEKNGVQLGGPGKKT